MFVFCCCKKYLGWQGHNIKDVHVPVSFSSLSRRPIVCRCFGVDTDSDMTSPIASWKPEEKNKTFPWLSQYTYPQEKHKSCLILIGQKNNFTISYHRKGNSNKPDDKSSKELAHLDWPQHRTQTAVPDTGGSTVYDPFHGELWLSRSWWYLYTSLF